MLSKLIASFGSVICDQLCAQDLQGLGHYYVQQVETYDSDKGEASFL